MKGEMAPLATLRASKLRSAGAAFFALFFLVLQPVCAAYDRHMVASHAASSAATQDAAPAYETSPGSPDRLSCCAEMRADATASASSAAPDKNFPATEIAAALPLALIARRGLTPPSLQAWSTQPPHPLPYHARSARIQR